MATETSTETVTDSNVETTDQEVVTSQDTTTDTTSTPEGNGTVEEPSSTTQQEPERLPEDHPLVKAYASSQSQLKELKGSQQASQAKVTELESEIEKLKSSSASSEQVQRKYDRLEAFLTSVGGPLSKALDSRSFTQALFESDQDINELVSAWHKSNPSATSSALGASAGDPGSSKDMNSLLRSAAR